MITAEIPKKEIADFNSLMKDLTKVSRKSLPRLVERASVRFCQTCKNASPRSKKRRKLERNPQYSKKAAQVESNTEDNYYSDALTKRKRYKIFRQGNEPYWAYTNETAAKREPGTLVKYQGALRNSWAGLIPKVGRGSRVKLQGNAKQSQMQLRRTIFAQVVKKSAAASTTIHNRISYIFDVTPNIMATGMQGAIKDANHQLERIRKAQKREWNK